MATVDQVGVVHPEESDILPREVAHRTDDPAEVTALINDLNPGIVTAEDLAAAIEKVDALRRKLADASNVGNPHIE